jgi:two-component system, NarL family, nitrate/nitrite response regulator NarL
MDTTPFLRLMLVGEDRAFAGRLLRTLREAEAGSMVLVGAVASVDEGCAQAETARPDVVLHDLAAGGLAALARLAARCAAPVLALTELDDAAAREEAVRAGASGALCKDEAPETLFKAVRKVAAGEVWLDRATLGRLLKALARTSQALALPDSGPIANLTARESDIVRALLRHEGANGRELSRHLGMSEQTLRNHFSAIYRKLGISNRLGLVSYASRLRPDRAA